MEAIMRISASVKPIFMVGRLSPRSLIPLGLVRESSSSTFPCKLSVTHADHTIRPELSFNDAGELTNV
jgi:hypothetical protein